VRRRAMCRPDMRIKIKSIGILLLEVMASVAALSAIFLMIYMIPRLIIKGLKSIVPTETIK